MQAECSRNLEEDRITSTKGQSRNVLWGKIITDVIWKLGVGREVSLEKKDEVLKTNMITVQGV